MDFLIHHMLQSSATRFPDKEALVDKDDRVIFQRAAKYIAGLADGLRGGRLTQVYSFPSTSNEL